MTYDVTELTQKLVSFPSVTPRDEGAQVYLAEKLEALGFECAHLPFGEGDETVSNLFARIGKGAPHICFAGHTDVVPTGPVNQWTFEPFSAHIKDGVLYGRGSSDMKGGIAAFLAAASEYLKKSELKGSISFLIAGDEEGIAANGTVKVLEWMEKNGHIPDVCLVGEPTNPDHLGQYIKIGRRGSLNGVLNVTGAQGHVAHPDLADNPMKRLIILLGALSEHVFDEGSKNFQPTNLEITSLNTDNTAVNIIPESGRAMFNIRFNDNWTKETLAGRLREVLDATGYVYDLQTESSGDSSITQSGAWSDIVQQAVQNITGLKPELTTRGGTSDARFITHYCPVLEYGGVNESIHKINENACVDDLKKLVEIYKCIIEMTDSSAPNIFL